MKKAKCRHSRMRRRALSALSSARCFLLGKKGRCVDFLGAINGAIVPIAFFLPLLQDISGGFLLQSSFLFCGHSKGEL